MGKLGFLAEIDPPEMADALGAIDEHRFTVEPRSAVCAEFQGQQTIAFNDVDLARIPGLSSSAVVELTVEAHPFVRYAADALIVATPTGSTAYNFSAGGPIVSPNVEGLLVTPAAPHSAFNRALFLAADEKLTLTVLPRSGELAVEADGNVVGYVHPGDTVVELSTVPDAAHVVRLGRTTFYQRAQRKLRLTGSAEATDWAQPAASRGTRAPQAVPWAQRSAAAGWMTSHSWLEPVAGRLTTPWKGCERGARSGRPLRGEP